MGTSHNKDEIDQFVSLSLWSQQTKGSLLRIFKVTLDVYIELWLNLTQVGIH